MSFKIYKGETVVAEGESPLSITDIAPDTDVAKGDYKAARVEGGKESNKVDIPAFKTLPIEVTGVTLTPKTSTADAGKADGANVAATIAPENATNKAVTYSIAPQTEGLSVSDDGRITWTEVVPSGAYTTTVNTTDGNKTDTHVLTLKEPVIAVTGVTISPKSATAESGTGANRQLNSTISPGDATNKSVTYSVAPETEGLSVNASGILAWTSAVGAGEYIVTVKTADGNKTDTCVLTLSAPEPEPEPDPAEEE